MVAVSEGRNDTSEGLRSVFILAVDIKYTNIKFTIIDIVLVCLPKKIFCQQDVSKYVYCLNEQASFMKPKFISTFTLF